MRRVLTPWVSAISRSWAAARMAKPARVPRMKAIEGRQRRQRDDDDDQPVDGHDNVAQHQDSLETGGMLRSCTSQIRIAPNIIIMLRPSRPIMLSNMRW